MVRTVLANKKQEKYLQKCGEEHQFAFGLIIGQPTEQNKDYIVHLARNSEQDVDVVEVPDSEGDADAARLVSQNLKSVGDIDSQALVNHVISVTKMLPGCFYVLGMFIVSEKSLFDDEGSLKVAKNLVQQINSVLKLNKNFYGSSNVLGSDGKFLLSYSTLAKSTTCKIFEAKEGGGFFMPVDWKYLDKPIEWHKVESNYELDDVFPMVEKDMKVNIEDHFQKTLEMVQGYVQNSEIFIQNENVEDTLTLETFLKQKQSKSDQLGVLKASIFLPALPSATDPIKIEKFNGTIRFSGVIASRVWSHPKNTIREIQTFIRNDVLRSLAARIQIYCDGLTDANAANDALVISEPPRRVFFDVPDGNGIQFSEYIFRGETPTVAAAQALEMLDLEIDSDKIHADLEGLLDDDAFTMTSSETELPSPRRSAQNEVSRTMYIVGVIIALLVLFVSILLHFILR